jgi:Glycosyl hydrolases family 16
MESRGNRKLFNGAVNVGVEQAGHTMHFGPNSGQNGWPTAHFAHNQSPGFEAGFHVYRLEWTPSGIRFLIDGELYGNVEAGNGFWERGRFTGTNPWAGASIMAPFDQEFFIIINNAVGGTNYFPDTLRNEGPTKPWHNDSPNAPRDFWNGRSGWEPTWNKATDDSHLQVDFVRVWAL